MAVTASVSLGSSNAGALGRSLVALRFGLLKASGTGLGDEIFNEEETIREVFYAPED
jgi:hypothetical protein